MTKTLGWLATAAMCVVMLGSPASAQIQLSGAWPALALDDSAREAAAPVSLPTLVSPVILPRMSPDLALQTYMRRAQQQSSLLLGYSDDTFMRADLPDYKQSGEYELKRQYAAPNTLQFTPVRFTGDGFVKSNVLVRLLQTEVDHVVKQQNADTAINEKNYKFSHKSVEMVGDRMVYVYHVKPRKKRVGLFKGRIFIDAYKGTLVRAEGQMVKSPSLFIKKVEFVQDYADIDGFTLPTHLRSVASVRIIGRTIVDIFHRGYHAVTANMASTSNTPQPAGGAAPSN